MASRFQKNYTDKGYKMHYHVEPLEYPSKNSVLQFLVEMENITPGIWRRIQVPIYYNFWDLHVAIQDAMGWKDYHLHHFEIKAKHKRKVERIGIPDFDGFGDMEEVFPGWEIGVTTYFNDLGIQAIYEYDYGDSWIHKVKLEGYLYKEPKTRYPICIGGERACPPEDCGGIPGYANVLATLANPTSDDYSGMRTWVGKTWDPEKFDPSAVKFDNPYKRWVGAFLKD